MKLVPAALRRSGAANGYLPLPPLNPVGFEPLLDPVVPLPGLSDVGFEPLLEPAPGAGLRLVAGGALAGVGPGAM